MPIHMNVRTYIGIALITFGVLAFADGAANNLAQDHYIKSAQEVSDLVNSATSAHTISKRNTIIMGKDFTNDANSRQ